MIFRPSSLNFPCGLGVTNLDNGREESEKNNNNNTFQSINHEVNVFHS
jgi:hypothetical protein